MILGFIELKFWVLVRIWVRVSVISWDPFGEDDDDVIFM